MTKVVELLPQLLSVVDGLFECSFRRFGLEREGHVPHHYCLQMRDLVDRQRMRSEAVDFVIQTFERLNLKPVYYPQYGHIHLTLDLMTFVMNPRQCQQFLTLFPTPS